VFSGLSQAEVDSVRLRLGEVVIQGTPVVTWKLLCQAGKGCSNLTIRLCYQLSHGTLAYKETALTSCLSCVAESLNSSDLSTAVQRLNLAWADRGALIDNQGQRVKLQEIALNGEVSGLDLLGREVRVPLG
jgi:hypothetical protein